MQCPYFRGVLKEKKFMKYCVVKNTTTVIDGSENNTDIMIQNAINAGYRESEVEILTEKEYTIRKSNEPIPTPQPSETDILGQQVAALTLDGAQKDTLIQQLGAQSVQMQLDIAALKGGAA
jgi:hypothetical protein